ncbi:MAG: peptidoglycan DD-metalloendopeptidase family protein [Lachnospiraceae bacterium]|nr:peptidoglycan DD-metalloendopeptidase family protein [Lachnospiraceae bacterium]
MKKFNMKTRLQWGWFKAALLGTAIGILIAPTAGEIIGASGEKKDNTENYISTMLSSISFGSKVKVMINGDVVALAGSKEAGEEAFQNARLAYNAKGVQILDIDVTYEEVDKEKDAETIKGMHLLRNEKLAEAVLDSFDKYAEADKELAYTMRIDDYTVTIDSMEDLVSVLEKAQGAYDTEDVFKVGLKPTASRNVTMYEVDVTKKEAKDIEAGAEQGSTQTPASQSVSTEMPGSEAGTQAGTEAQTEDTGSTTESPGEPGTQTEPPSEEGQIFPIEKNKRVLLTGAEASTEGETSSEGGAGDTQASTEGEPAGEGTQAPAEGENAGEGTQTPEEDEAATPPSEMLPQAADDGIKYVGFSETIQVMETYVNKEQIKDKDTAYSEMTAKNAEADIYVVERGDCLSIIAEKTNMSVEEIKELNPSIESDDNLFYDDRLNITVPTAAVQVLVEKQETYQENYNEEVVYQDDDSMYIGETEVVQEGTPGSHIVTDLVTYKDDMECDREQLQETVEVAAVAQIVKRGTKSKPTYMFPVTNWNVTSNFGYRWGRLHAGTDVGVPTGTTVRASRAGQVITAGWLGGYGNCVIIDHGDGVCTRYGHLSEVTVSVGQYVDQGQQVALSGNTGRSTGPHLHFEIRINGEAVDPTPYLYQTQ